MLLKRELLITEDVIQRARALGLDGSEHEYGVYGEMLDMVGASAIVTHPKGDRRFDEWLFRLKGFVICDIHLIRCDQCDDRRRIVVLDDCPNCDGVGCRGCRGSGRVRSQIPCENCTEVKRS